MALLHHDGCVSACDFSRDSECLLCDPIYIIEAILFWFAAITDTGSLLVSCGFDMQVNVWDMNNYQLINCYKVGLASTIVINLCTFKSLCLAYLITWMVFQQPAIWLI